MRSPLIGALLFGLCLLLLIFSTLPVREKVVMDKGVAYQGANTTQVEARLNRSNVAELTGNTLGLIIRATDSLSAADLRALMAQVPLTNVHLELPESPLRDSLLVVLHAYAGATPLLISQPVVLQGADWDLDWSVMLTLEDSLIDQVATAVGQRARQDGVSLLLAPDLHTLMRAENRLDFAAHVHRFQLGLEAQGVLLALGPAQPYYPQERDSLRLDSILAPLSEMGRGGLAGVWVSSVALNRIHLNSRREQIISRYLTRKTAFQGLVLGEVAPGPDADLEETVRKMLKAGTDIMYAHPDQVSLVYSQLKDAYLRSSVPADIFMARNKTLLMARYWAGGDSLVYTSPDQTLPYRLAQQNLTLLRRGFGQLPLGGLDSDSVRVWIWGDSLPYFTDRMRRYGPVSVRYLPIDNPLPSFRAIDRPDVWVWNSETVPALAASTGFAFKDLPQPPIIVHFGGVASLTRLDSTLEVLHQPGKGPMAQDLTAQAIWGGVSPLGVSPLAWGTALPYGERTSYAQVRIGFGPPALAQMRAEQLAQIDSIVAEGIDAFAMPGCQVLVARRGQVVYDRSFGFHTYGQRDPVQASDLYDIASVTKVAATTLGAMTAYDRGEITLDQPLSDFFRDPYYTEAAIDLRDTVWMTADSLARPLSALIHQTAQRTGSFRVDTIVMGDSVQLIRSFQRPSRRMRSRVFSLHLGELMTHTSGLPAGLPILGYMYYRDSVTGRYDRFYAPQSDEIFTVPVAARLHMRGDYQDSIWQAVKGLSLDPEKRYMYSDANMILVQRALDSLHQESLNTYLERELYHPLGMSRTLFKPLERFGREEIAPTEHDIGWRGQVLRGSVHDPTAALMGGVAGNAGLFSNATDLAHLFQMLLNQGHYGGQRYLQPATVRRFTRVQAGHRGYGFDKPPRQGAYIIGRLASPDSYGHTGFTGTCVWVDPQEELIFIFLSNRVHPNPKNWKLNTLAIRQRIHDAVYASLDTDIAKQD